MNNLKQARQNSDLESFVKEHEADPKGDIDKLDAVIKRPVQGSEKAARSTSSRADRDD